MTIVHVVGSLTLLFTPSKPAPFVAFQANDKFMGRERRLNHHIDCSLNDLASLEAALKIIDCDRNAATVVPFKGLLSHLNYIFNFAKDISI